MNKLVIPFKKLVRSVLRATNYLFSWVTTPIVAIKQGGRFSVLSHNPIVAFEHKGVFNGIREAESTFATVVNSLDAESIPYYVYKQNAYAISVCVMAENKTVATNCLFSNENLKGYHYKITKARFNTDTIKLMGLRSRLSSKEINNLAAIDLFRYVAGPAGRIVGGDEFRTTVEFWSKPQDLDTRLRIRAMKESGIIDSKGLKGSIIAPTSNGIAKVVSAKDQTTEKIGINGKKYDTLSILNQKRLNHVDFPIDIVYTWVNGSDPEWLKGYYEAKREVAANHQNNSMSRYNDNNELKYSLRSLEMYAPWVNKVYLVTADQRPDWLEPNSKLEIVSHRDIFEDESALPVYNSHAIETQLHRIKGLSENYIYMNDDVFFGKPTQPEDFFFSNGVAKVLISPATIGTGRSSDYESAPSSAGKNARKIIYDKFGVYITNKYRHTAHPQKKSVAVQITNENQVVVDRTMRSKFRSPNDVPFTSTLMQSYLLASANGVIANSITETVNISSPNVKQQLKKTRKSHSLHTFCLNESDTSKEDQKDVKLIVDDYLSDYFPFPSSWES